ncbi:head-tail connector protein [Paracoccus jeotgali]|uniref:head-tail connector protein n=1 Tax=Paracoccus jeotgali TaxID=2065379 RepID=UPI0028AB8AFE|nr:hypothetical protein [Paracoccus jeotgali]
MRLSVERRRTDHGLPVEMAAIQDYLRVLTDDGRELAELQRLVLAAMREIEETASLALFDQEISVWGGIFDRRDWPMTPICPVSYDHPVTLTHRGENHSIDPADWQGSRYLPRPGFDVTDPFRLTYTAGFGTTAADLPEDLVLAVLDQAAAYYDNRGSLDPRAPRGLTPHAARIAARYRGVRL